MNADQSGEVGRILTRLRMLVAAQPGQAAQREALRQIHAQVDDELRSIRVSLGSGPLHALPPLSVRHRGYLELEPGHFVARRWR